MAQVTAVNISEKKGVRKHEVPYIDVKYRHGIVGDAHAGDWHRQISLLADESVDTMRDICPLELDAGIFAENINTRGIDNLGRRIIVRGEHGDLLAALLHLRQTQSRDGSDCSCY